MGDGDGWIRCSRGHRHWGRYGAAGLLLRDGHGRWVLQHRAEWTHEGGTWGIPGGACDSHESPVVTALREAHEEADIQPDSVRPTGLLVDDHGGWSYTTVVADVLRPVLPHAANAESETIDWRQRDEVQQLPLHSGFSVTWPRLRDCGPGLVLLIDLDDWQFAAPSLGDESEHAVADRLIAILAGLSNAGVEHTELPDGATWQSPLSRHFPRFGFRSGQPERTQVVMRRAQDAALQALATPDEALSGDHVITVKAEWLSNVNYSSAR